MKYFKTKIAVLALSLCLVATSGLSRNVLTEAHTTVSCTWSNGDHFSFTSSNDEFIDSMIAHCMDTGGTAVWN